MVDFYNGVALARERLQEGEFRQAAAALRNLADGLDDIADRTDRALDDPINLSGSGPVPIVPRDNDPHDPAPTAHPQHGDGWSPWGARRLSDREG